MSQLGDVAWAVARITFGASLALLHGYGKLFGGKVVGLTRTVEGLGFPFPAFFAWAASLAEFVGGLLVAVGLLTRPAAGACAFTMLVALYNHRNDPPARMELALLYFTMMLLIVFTGGGRYSLDRFVRVRSPFGRST